MTSNFNMTAIKMILNKLRDDFSLYFYPSCIASLIISYFLSSCYIHCLYKLFFYKVVVFRACFLIRYIFITSGTYSLTLTPNDRFLRIFFRAGLFTLRFFARNLLRGKSPKKYIFFIFRFDV